MLWYWVAWGVMFGAGEGWALFNRTPGDTLSETVWYWVLGYRWAHPAKPTAATMPTPVYAHAFQGADIHGGPTFDLPVERRSAWTWRTFAVGAFLLWLFFHGTFGMFAG